MLKELFNILSGGPTQEKLDLDLLNVTLRGDRSEVRRLLAEGARFDTADEQGRTPLYFAASGGHSDLVHLFLDLGAHTEAGKSADLEGTPLTSAARAGSPASVEALVAAKADLNATTYEWRTAMHEAILNGNEDMAVFLAKAGTNPNTTSRMGTSPLVDAVAANMHQAVLALCEGGADAQLRDRLGYSMQELITQKHWQDVIDVLDRPAREAKEAKLREIADRENFAAEIKAAPVLQSDLAVGKPLVLRPCA